MNLSTTIALYAGGPGSGCNPEKGKCGRRSKDGGVEQPLPRGRQGFERIDSELRTAAKALRAVVMEYRPGDSEETRTYVVHPYSYRGDRFFGYDTVSKSIKAFKIANIVRVQQTNKKFKPKWKVELTEGDSK